MVSRATFLGVAAILVAALLIVSLLAGYYFLQYQNEASSNSNYENELSGSLSKNAQLAGDLSATLQEYNSSLAVLAEAVANLNTSSSAYANASKALPVLWNEYLTLARQSKSSVETYSVDLLIDFENGTTLWYNNTAVQPGWNGYTITVVALKGDVASVWYPAFGEHLVTGLDGVNSGASTSWFFWERSGSVWQLTPSGADDVQVTNGTDYAWTVCGYNSSTYLPTCVP